MTDREALVRSLHRSAPPYVLATTGGGANAIAELLRVPGGSRTLLEAVVPYSASALNGFLGGAPEHYCCPRTARLLGMAAWRRAQRWSEATAAQVETLLGIGCTASLVSEPPKRGPHRFHIGVQSAEVTRTFSLSLVKGARDRAGEEDLVSQAILNELADAAGLADRLPLALVPGETAERDQIRAPAEWTELLLAKRHVAGAVAAVGQVPRPQDGPRALFPGAFNPLHEGHRQMAQAAARLLQAPVHFELSLENVDKLPLDFHELRQRLQQFGSTESVWLTRAATFVIKAELFPGATFVVGADTILRIADPKYYGGDASRRDVAVRELAARKVSFLVFGRQIGGTFRTLEELALPSPLAELCRGVPADVFRADISSTMLRQAPD